MAKELPREQWKEYHHQKAVVRYCEEELGFAKKEFTATGNGAFLKNGAASSAGLTASGVHNGVPDLIFWRPLVKFPDEGEYRGLVIEMKSLVGSFPSVNSQQTLDQYEQLTYLGNNGWVAASCRGDYSAIKVLRACYLMEEVPLDVKEVRYYGYTANQFISASSNK